MGIFFGSLIFAVVSPLAVDRENIVSGVCLDGHRLVSISFKLKLDLFFDIDLPNFVQRVVLHAEGADRFPDKRITVLPRDVDVAVNVGVIH